MSNNHRHSQSNSHSQIVWITGASSGIGEALVLYFAGLGKQVIASARSKTKLQALTESEHRARIHLMPCDVTNRQELQQTAEAISAKFGRVDTVIVNAGNCEYFSVAEPDWDMMRRVMEVNYFGAINTVEAVLPLLRHSSNPHLVAVASMASDVPFPKAQAYGSSKAAVKYFFDSLRIDLNKENIPVTVVQPGFVETPLTDKNDFPMPFLISVDKAAQIIGRGLDRKPLLIRFPRRLAWILGTMKFFPSLWHAIAKKNLVDSQSNQHQTTVKTGQH